MNLGELGATVKESAQDWLDDKAARLAAALAYGAAGSLIALVVWVSYATQMLLVGAEFTQVQARRHGRDIRPSKSAVRTGAKKHDGPSTAPAKQGA